MCLLEKICSATCQHGSAKAVLKSIKHYTPLLFTVRNQTRPDWDPVESGGNIFYPSHFIMLYIMLYVVLKPLCYIYHDYKLLLRFS